MRYKSQWPVQRAHWALTETGTRLGQNCVYMVCMSVHAKCCAQMGVHGYMVGICLFFVYVQICLHASYTLYVSIVHCVVCVHIYRSYYSVQKLSDIGDEGLEFNLCHKHTGHT